MEKEHKGQTLKILIVESGSTASRSRREAIEAAGHVVEVAPGDGAGLDRVNANGVDIILLDYAEQRNSHEKLIEEMGKQFPGIPIVLVTAETANSVGKDGTSETGAPDRCGENEQLFRTIADVAPALMWMSDAIGGFVYVNRGWRHFTGRELGAELGAGWQQSVHPEDLDRRREAFASALERQGSFSIEYRLKRHDGEYHWMLDRGEPWKTAVGAFGGYVGSCLDLTRQTWKEKQDAPTAAGPTLETSNGPLGTAAVPAPESAPANPLTHDFYHSMWEALLTKGRWRGKICACRKNGDDTAEWITISAQRNGPDEPAESGVVFDNPPGEGDNDSNYQAYHDALTGLPNRRLFIDRLGHALARAGREKQLLAVMALDLDNFKHINDSLGHATGDTLIKKAAGRMARCLREVDTVSRLGGDEFTILLENIGQEKEAAAAAARIITSLSRPYTFLDEELFITVSVGIAFYPADGSTQEDLIKNADVAMYHAKDLGKNRFQFFTQWMNEKVVKRIEMESNMRKAIDRNEMLVYYQPKVDLATGRVAGMEALLRWRRAGGEIVLPLEFIWLAEETGFIVTLDEWILRAACGFTKRMSRAGFDALSVAVNVSINLSAKHLDREDLVEMILRTAQETGLDPARLELEVTESAIIRNVGMAIDTIQRLRDLGFNVSIDDFGTGYSSLNYLAKFPINILKMDRSFVVDLPHNQNAQSIARAIVAMAHDMNIKVVAEGAEKKSQLDFLRSIGCDEVQGFIFSPPVPEKEMEKLLRAKPFVVA